MIDKLNRENIMCIYKDVLKRKASLRIEDDKLIISYPTKPYIKLEWIIHKNLWDTRLKKGV